MHTTIGKYLIIIGVFIVIIGVLFYFLGDKLNWIGRLPGDIKVETTKSRKLAYCFFITLLGVIIDWAYFELTWDTHFARSAVWAPATSQALQFAWLLLPMIMIFLVNAALSYSYLKLERRLAIIFGVIMGLFTAPWLLPTLPYAFGWVS